MQKKDEHKIICNDAFLASGNDFKLNSKVIVKHPSIESIYNLGNGLDCEDVYWEYVGILLSDPYAYMIMLDDLGIDYETQTPFDVFILRWKFCNAVYKENQEVYDSAEYHPVTNIKKALCFFLGEHNFNVAFNADTEQYVLVDEDSLTEDNDYDYIITSELFGYINDFITQINQIDNSSKINPKDESVKKMLLEDMRDEINRRQKYNRKDDSPNIIGKAIIGICGGADGSVNYISVKQYKVFQVLSTLRVKVKQLHSMSLLQGIYAGTIDSSKINKKELDWI